MTLQALVSNSLIMLAGIVHFLLRQNPCNFRRPVSLASHLIDSADNRRRFLVNQPVVLDIRVFSVAIAFVAASL